MKWPLWMTCEQAGWLMVGLVVPETGLSESESESESGLGPI